MMMYWTKTCKSCKRRQSGQKRHARVHKKTGRRSKRHANGWKKTGNEGACKGRQEAVK
jgi:hypothetical protein